MTFTSGNNANPKGRPVGSKNKLARDFDLAYEELKSLPGYQHPIKLMYQWAMDPNKPIEIRAAMLKEFASYICPKPKLKVSVDQVPTFESAEQAEAFLAEFISVIAPHLEPPELATMTRQFILSKREGRELELKAIQGDPNKPIHIQIEGGLPTPPGLENVIMPHKVNGHQGPVIEGSSTETPRTSSGESQNKDPSPTGGTT